MKIEIKNEELVNSINQINRNELTELNKQLKLKKMNTETKNEELDVNSNESQLFTPSKEWFKTYRREMTDSCIINRINYLIEDEDWSDDVLDNLDDSEFLVKNYPSFTEKEIQNYILEEYNYESTFLFRLKRFLNQERLSMKTDYDKMSEEMKEWYVENIDW
jgi:hypothetical protein